MSLYVFSSLFDLFESLSWLFRRRRPLHQRRSERDGKIHQNSRCLVVHHGIEYRVLANDPSYTDSLVDLSRYDFTNATRDIPLPGNTNSMDRFIRANFYIDFLRKTQPSSRQIAVSSLLSVARNVSAPIGAPYANPGSSTATDWRTVSDLTNRTYYFESTSRLSLLYTDLRTLNLSIGTPVRVINPLIPQSLHGNINRYYKPVKMPPFYGK